MNIISINTLKAFFKISVGAFDFARTIREASGQRDVKVSSMEWLHRNALKELETESPRPEYLDMLLSKMEALAVKNKANEQAKVKK